MNDGDDEEIDELFGRIKQIGPPLEARMANREAVAAELEKLKHNEPVKVVPLWRRSVAIPAPVLAASIVLLVYLATISSKNVSTTTVGLVDQTVDNEILVSPLNDGVENVAMELAVPKRVLSASVQVEHRGSTVYLCGIGPIRTESRSFVEE